MKNNLYPLLIVTLLFSYTQASGIMFGSNRNESPEANYDLADTHAISESPHALFAAHLHDPLHAFIWRNWNLVPVETLARVVRADPQQVEGIAAAMGLPGPIHVNEEQLKRSYITIIRRNWHLLPYDQLLVLLGWSREYLDFILKEDDFLFAKLGSVKPECDPVYYVEPDKNTRKAESHIKRIIDAEIPGGISKSYFKMFDFPEPEITKEREAGKMTPSGRTIPRICYSYAALYGDPLLDTALNPYPDHYLEALSASGINGIWLPAILYKLTAFPWDPDISLHYRERQKNLLNLVIRAHSFGIGVYLYLNEPRSMPDSFFVKYPDLKGVTEGNFSALCTSLPETREYITEAVSEICRKVPGLAGFITITASENLTNCWSHFHGQECKRCSLRKPAEVIAEVNNSIYAGIRKAMQGVREVTGKSNYEKVTSPRLVVWDWAWPDDWEKEAIDLLSDGFTFMTVSEWGIPISRGGVESRIGEYSLSVIGPGERALKLWDYARKRGLDTFAKIQANITWEISAIPYNPVNENVAINAENLRNAGVDGVMAGWTLGGYPSPNLEILSMILDNPGISAEAAMKLFAIEHYGADAADYIVDAWKGYSRAFREFPFNINVVYRAPLQYGPSNLLWPEPTGYKASMVGFGYDDIESWRSIYPENIFIDQLEKIVEGFSKETARLIEAKKDLKDKQINEISYDELIRMASVVTIHYKSIVNQYLFIRARDVMISSRDIALKHQKADEIKGILKDEIRQAKDLFALQMEDPRIGFEASNQYYYVPIDLVEKIINCRYLLDIWLPGMLKGR